VIDLEDLPAAVRGIGPTASFYLGAAHPGYGKPAQVDTGEEPEHGPGTGPHTPQIPQGLREEGAGEGAGLPLKPRIRLEERKAVEEALRTARTVAAAARLLGIPRQTLQYKMRVLGIAVPTTRK